MLTSHSGTLHCFELVCFYIAYRKIVKLHNSQIFFKFSRVLLASLYLKSSRKKKDLNDVTAAPFLRTFSQLPAAKKTTENGAEYEKSIFVRLCPSSTISLRLKGYCQIRQYERATALLNFNFYGWSKNPGKSFVTFINKLSHKT